MTEIGILLRKCREQKGLSQENIADTLGVTPSTISKIEMGKTKAKFETIVRFCNAMDVNLSDILSSGESHDKNSCNINLNINISSPAALKECLQIIDEHKFHKSK